MLKNSKHILFCGQAARTYCEDNGIAEVTSSILFYHILKNEVPEDKGVKLLSKIGASISLILKRLELEIEQLQPSVVVEKTSAEPSQELKALFTKGRAIDYGKEVDEFGCAEFILACLRDGSNVVALVLNSFDITYEKYHAIYYKDIVSKPADNADRQEINSKIPNITIFAKNLNLLAKTGKLNPVVGRDLEIDAVMKILCRRTKNNPILLGDAGVGKTSVIEGLAQLIVQGLAPANLHDREVYALDITKILAGTKFRGDFEKRIQGIVAEAEANPNIILFIDEIHTMMGAGSSMEDGLDMSNILKPALSRGTLTLIGATTIEEYDKTIYKNGALRRRFSKVVVNEPDENALKIIINRVMQHAAEYYKLQADDTITPEFIMELGRYVNTTANPDKVIEIIDSTFANVVFEVNSEKADNESDRIAAIENLYNKRKVSRNDFIYATETISKVPARFLDVGSNSEYISEASSYLNNNIINQDPAAVALLRVIAESKAGISDPSRPRCVLYFDGVEGCGKSELAYLFSEIVLGSRESLYRLDMNQFKNEGHITKLTGAPPSFVGYNDVNNDLLTHIRRSNIAVVLLDEIDAAHPSVLDFFVSMFERGYVEDAHSNRVFVKNCYFIMTGNVTSGVLKGQSRSLGFGDADSSELDKKAQEAIKKRFSPKFLDRVDEVVICNTLNRSDLKKIANLHVIKMNAYMPHIKFFIEDVAMENIIDSVERDAKGARILSRQINKTIKPLVADAAINGESMVIIKYDEGFKWKSYGKDKGFDVEAASEDQDIEEQHSN